MAEAFRTQGREAATRAHPELANAYKAVDVLRAEFPKAMPADRPTAERVDLAMRNAIADRVQGGKSLEITDQDKSAFRTEVAFANLRKAADDRRAPVPKPYQLPEAQRAHLVDVAKEIVGGQRHDFGLDTRESPVLRATLVATELSVIDYPKQNDPFQEPKLSQMYERSKRAMDYIESAQQKTLPDPPGKDIER